jgi:hypothetical protein
MLAAIVNVPANLGYPLLGVLVGAEAAGALVPGETSLIVAGALAAQGRLALPLVIAVGGAAAIIGDNIGYQLGRRGLRRLLKRRAAGRRAANGRSSAAKRSSSVTAPLLSSLAAGCRVYVSSLPGSPGRTGCRGQLPLLECPRGDHLGGHSRHGGLSTRPSRLRILRRDRIRRRLDRHGRLPRAPSARTPRSAAGQLIQPVDLLRQELQMPTDQD